jgi:hypothetical protein
MSRIVASPDPEREISSICPPGRHRAVRRRLALVLAGLAALPAVSAEPGPEARWNAVVACASRADRDRHACVDGVLRDAGVLGAAAASGAKDAPDPDVGKFTLGAVAEARNGFLTLTTEQGAVWRQTETRPPAPTPRAGQTLTVRKGLTGSPLCQVEGAAVFRCTRSR